MTAREHTYYPLTSRDFLKVIVCISPVLGAISYFFLTLQQAVTSIGLGLASGAFNAWRARACLSPLGIGSKDGFIPWSDIDEVVRGETLLGGILVRSKLSRVRIHHGIVMQPTFRQNLASLAPPNHVLVLCANEIAQSLSKTP